MARSTVPASLGLPVTSRTFSWNEMVRRAWGSEFSAPDHRVYVWSNGRGFDSTDRGTTGFYKPNILDILTEQGYAIQMEPPADSVGDPILVE
jgi:hypothetical protein